MVDDKLTEQERRLATVAGGPGTTSADDLPDTLTDPVTMDVFEHMGPLSMATIDLGNGWSARAYFDARTANSLDIVALTIVPTKASQPPKGGLDGKALDRIKLNELREDFLARIAVYHALVASGLQAIPDDAEGLANLRRRLPAEREIRRAAKRLRPAKRGPRSDDERMADITARFLEAQIRDPRRALLEMEEQYFKDGTRGKDGRSIPYTTVRNWVAQATKDGWLVGQGQGKQGGKMPGPKYLAWLEARRPEPEKEEENQ
jgi:hypothetical protein